MTATELAARYLSAWDGCGASWFADCNRFHAEDLGDTAQAGADALPVAARGRVEEQAGVQARSRVTRLRRWKRTAGRVAIPFHRPSHDVATALAMANLAGPLPHLLLVYACETWAEWPKAERYLLAIDGGQGAREAWVDGMALLLWGTRRGTVPAGDRARSLGIRKEAFLEKRRAARRRLAGWLDTAARAFLEALHGNPKHPADDLVHDRTAPSAPAPRAAPRIGRQPDSRRATGWWDASYARRMRHECPVRSIAIENKWDQWLHQAVEGTADQCHGGQPMQHESSRTAARGS